MKHAALSLIAIGLAAPAHAEGARIVLTCQIQTLCGPGGLCAAAEGEVAIDLAPLDIGDRGDGLYRIGIAGWSGEATSLTQGGILVWSTDASVNTLAPNGNQGEMVWHERPTTADMSGIVRFLSCEEV